MELHEIKIGDRFVINSAFGSGPIVVGKVEGVHENVKNGQPGIDYIQEDNGRSHWAYLYQVMRAAD